MRVLVCGGRDFADWRAVERALDRLHAERGPITAVIHGNAAGADSQGRVWAKLNRVKEIACPAEWSKFGKSAGPRRNQNMLGHGPAVVVAFPGGRGTADMVKRARMAGVEVIEASGSLLSGTEPLGEREATPNPPPTQQGQGE